MNAEAVWADDDTGDEKPDQRRRTETVRQGDDRDGEADQEQQVTEQSDFWHRHGGYSRSSASNAVCATRMVRKSGRG